ncbi:helix-turn-helix domain-containing protein [Paenibacillus sp. 2KB_22]|uniref:helix-turn-helix domain-containing protein n=1 Tax=Paenibacillus sp. 2KB_22 TaxID=3232978 RepID=UPI003F9BF339
MSAGFDAISFHGSPTLWNNRHQTISTGIDFYHWHQCCELLLVFGGEGTVVINSQTYPIAEGMLFLFQPFEIHKVYAKATDVLPYDRTVVHLNHLHIESLLQSFPRRHKVWEMLCYSSDIERAFHLGEHFEAVRQCMEEYEQIVQNDLGVTQEEIIVFLLRLLTLMEKIIPETRSSSPVQWRRDEYSERIMNWIEENYMESDILNKLADELHLTRSYVSRVFKKETGSNLSEYLVAKRIQVAAHLLESTSIQVDNIAHQVGFQNVSHFISRFKKTYCLTPLQYRLKVKKIDYL